MFDNFAQLISNLAKDSPKVIVLESLFTALPNFFEHLTDALDVLAVAILEALLQHATQGGVDVSVIEQIVGELLHNVEGVNLESLLCSIPGGIAKARS